MAILNSKPTDDTFTVLSPLEGMRYPSNNYSHYEIINNCKGKTDILSTKCLHQVTSMETNLPIEN